MKSYRESCFSWECQLWLASKWNLVIGSDVDMLEINKSRKISDSSTLLHKHSKICWTLNSNLCWHIVTTSFWHKLTWFSFELHEVTAVHSNFSYPQTIPRHNLPDNKHLPESASNINAVLYAPSNSCQSSPGALKKLKNQTWQSNHFTSTIFDFY